MYNFVQLSKATLPSVTITFKFFKLSNSFIKFDVTKPFESKMLPSADRINRKEVYEHLWGTMDLGVVSLSQGFTKLKLKALKIPKSEVIELKEVHLIRKR